MSEEEEEFVVKKHVRYFSRCLDILPTQCQPLDSNRMTILFFCLSGLDILDNISVIDNERRAEIIEWIYSHQILPDQSDESSLSRCGFRGASFLGIPHDNVKSPRSYPYDCSHIAMTYTAMSCLLILGDDLSKVNREAVLAGLRTLQRSDGSFCSTIEQSESDMRFVYCACCVSYILNDWSAINVDLTADYIKKSLAYNFGFGQGPFLESHGGSTYCAVASLVLMKKLDSVLTLKEIERIERWCIMRQLSGFQGRPNKPVDTCYSFWIGATLEMLGVSDWVDKELNVGFILSTEGQFTGGFSKWPKCHPDPLHSYLGLCGLSLMNYSQLKPINASLNISQRAAEWLQAIHDRHQPIGGARGRRLNFCFFINFAMPETISLPHSHKEWPLVKEKLQRLADKSICGPDALASVVQVSPEWGLDKPPMLNVLRKVLGAGDYYTVESFSEDLLPYIAKRALAVEELFPTKDIPLLLSGCSGIVSLNRYRTSCLLALAFFHLLPRSGTHRSRYQQLSLLDILEMGFFRAQQSKCLCILGYFDRLAKSEREGDEEFMNRCVSIERRILDREISSLEYWKKSEIPLGAFEVHASGVIEEHDGALQADFANEYIGGGVLQQGNVQEEIRFVINPECLVSLLICEAMNKHEAILITGAERFSCYSGYGGGFTYAGPYTDPNPVDPVNNRCSVSIVAIDAIPAAWLPGGASYQFKDEAILRETCKAYCGFSFSDIPSDEGQKLSPVATGNWGCGAFGGNKRLKTLIQWMSTSQAGRTLHYYTFSDKGLSEKQEIMKACLLESKVTVGQLFSFLVDNDFIEKAPEKGIFEYAMEKLGTK